ncbi:MAG: hypothetical protein H6747_09475 [Deltaproteobacteria bacterium]|nr:hypothetical protein [Deltaproteobacteria bacterium]
MKPHPTSLFARISGLAALVALAHLGPLGCTSEEDAGAACAAATALTPTPAGCNPLAPEWGDCTTPWPSDVFRSVDGDAASVVIPAAAQPLRKDGGRIDFLGRVPTDGFSRLPIIAVRAAEGWKLGPAVVGYPLAPGAADPALSTQTTHPTLLLDAETGALLPHWVELDPRAAEPARQALILRSLTILQPGHRYVVALQQGSALMTAASAPQQAPAGFAAARDGAGDDALRCALEADVFPPLKAAGVARSGLLLAWSFTTATDQSTRGEMLQIRAAALDAMVQTPVEATVTAVDEPKSGSLGRRVEVEFTVPLYVAHDKAGARIHRGPDGKPAQNGTATVPATIWIPRNVLDGTGPAGKGPARLLQFGHGFFGDRSEAGGFGLKFAATHGFVVGAIDWWGMSVTDRAKLITTVLDDPAAALDFVDRLHQGMVNQIAFAEALQGALAQRKELQRPDGSPLYDSTQVYFYGISQGHILGSTYVALSPKIERAVLAVGGVSFGLMMSRAAPFGPFLGLFDIVSAGADASFDMTLQLQTLMDRIDPVAWTGDILQASFAPAPAQRRVLMHVAVGDTSVPNIATHVQARALGLPQLGPAPRPLFGIPEQAGPIDGSALCAWDFGYAQPDLTAVPNKSENPVHNDQRGLAASMAQASAFLQPGGKVVSTCDGVCDPE